MTVRTQGRPGRRRLMSVVLVLLLAAGGTTALVACGSDGGGGDTSTSPRPTPPDTASFTGTPPSALASADASARASASAAASSASAAASSFEASVSAETARANQEATAELKKVEGGGNAMADVSLRGKPRAETGGLLAVVVTITNRSDRQASYAVQVDFTDPSGEVRESRIVGARELEPGEKAQPLAISRKPADLDLRARVAKAQRY
ncbi:hypothetical protein [Streptomyces sp. NPDC054887]